MNLDTLAARVGDVTDPSPETLLAARHRLDEAIRAADHRVVAVRRTRRPRRRVITALVGAAAAAAAVVAVPVLTAGPASAEAVLLLAADAAAQQPDEAAGAAYWHVTSEVVDYQKPEPFRREIWQGRAAASVLRDGGLAREAGRDVPVTETLGGPATFGAVGGHSLSWSDLDALPTDAGELGDRLRQLVAGGDVDEADALWDGVTGLLRESPATPALRRSLWQVAATLPGVELLGPRTDAIGRQGTAIARDSRGGSRMIVVLDPTHGILLEMTDVDADGTTRYRYTLIDQGPSATAPRADPPICGPGSLSGESC